MNALEIKEARKKIGSTQSEFASLLGVSLGAVQQWESGNRNITSSTALLINNIVNKQSKSEDLLIAPHHGSQASDVPTEEELLNLINQIEDSELRSTINTKVHKLFKEVERLKNKMSSVIDILDGKK